MTAVLAAAGPALRAQDPAPAVAPDPATRAAEWDSRRAKKAEDLRPPERSGLEKFLYDFREKRVMERLAEGWHHTYPKFGGLQTGSGFTMGAEYRRERMWEGVLDVRATALGSIRRYEKYELQIGMPRLLHEHAFLDFTTGYRNLPQEDYWGVGPRTRKQDRTNFRLEDMSYIGAAGVRPWKKLVVGVRGGIIDLNVGPGTDSRYTSTEKVFNDQNSPGLTHQPYYYLLGAFTRLDYRDQPGNPRSGGNYLLEYNYYGDRTNGLYSFRRYGAEFQQYVPFFNRRRTLAFRARASLTDTSPANTVPFFMLETLGGSEDLRGFREFRFRDKNQMVYNLEYRWEAFSGLDMALFGDAGKVFANRSDFNLSNLEGAYGIGLRFNTEQAVFLRIDVAKSHEGVRFFFKFGHVF